MMALRLAAGLAWLRMLREPPELVKSISKTQIDRLGDRLRRGQVGDVELRQLDDFRRAFVGAYEEVVTAIRKVANLQPTGRPAKSTTSIIEKLRRETMRLSQMQDIAGCRLVVKSIVEQDAVVAQLKDALPSSVVIDRRKQPSFGYRAVHLVVTAQGKPVEVQVRTELQHLWAQLSEKLSDVFDPAIKYGGGDSEVWEILSGISKNTADFEVMELTHKRLRQQALGRTHESQDKWESMAKEFAKARRGFGETLERAVAKAGDLPKKQTGD